MRGTVSNKPLLRLSCASLVDHAEVDSEQEQSQPSSFSDFLRPDVWDARMPEKTAMGNILIHISLLLPAFLPWVVPACQRRRQTGTVSHKFLPTVPCVSPAGGAEEDGEQDLSFATHSSLRISRERCWTGTRRGTVSVKSLLIVPCVSPVGGAEEDGEQEQS